MTFLDHYLNYAAVNESPRSYHLWSGLSLISAIVGRRVFTDMELFSVYPQMYVVLAGPPGVAKSTAMDVAKDFVKLNCKQLAMAPAATTKEAVVQMMGKDDSHCVQKFIIDGKPHKFSQLSIFADEIVSLLMCGGRPEVMVDFLTEIFSGKDYREATKNKGDYEIRNPYIGLLACCTIETLKQLVNQKVVSGGMSRRCVFVVERTNSHAVPRIKYTEDQLASREFCKNTWHKLQMLCGGFTWEEEALKFYDNWYVENFNRINKCQSAVLQHFLRTKPVYCIKLSMLLAVAAENPQLVHTVETFRRATEIVSSAEDGASRLFDNEGRNELASIGQEIEDWLKMQPPGPVLYKRIYTVFWKSCKDGNTAEIDRILEHLQRTGKVDISSTYQESVSVRYVTWKG